MSICCDVFESEKSEKSTKSCPPLKSRLFGQALKNPQSRILVERLRTAFQDDMAAVDRELTGAKKSG